MLDYKLQIMIGKLVQALIRRFIDGSCQYHDTLY